MGEEGVETEELREILERVRSLRLEVREELTAYKQRHAPRNLVNEVRLS